MKIHMEQTQKRKNFKIQNEISERGAVIFGKGQRVNGSCSRGILQFSTQARLEKPRDRAGKSGENAGGSGFKPANERMRRGGEQASSSEP